MLSLESTGLHHTFYLESVLCSKLTFCPNNALDPFQLLEDRVINLQKRTLAAYISPTEHWTIFKYDIGKTRQRLFSCTFIHISHGHPIKGCELHISILYSGDPNAHAHTHTIYVCR